ncbi:tumor necrosis factor ligand superfamily member 11-like [Pomacea canaliculata]|uniref:tumor necrosis factor ligand superfamily member 11-like n=1 Tax=Pomacea canaliculata TaxID=400727 RepID=UPI000D731CD6|nr:tumor necrosis factor ligand superfamily member 11-like [Pomacea canaliculata]
MGFSTLFGSKTITTDSKLPGNTLMSSDVEQQSHDRYRHLCREPGEVVVRSRPALRLAILSFVITVVCFLIVAATAVVVVVRSHVAARQESEEQTCVPCLQLTPDPTSEVKSMLLETLDVHVEADEEICCARTRSQYAAVFKLILLRQQGARHLAEILKESDYSVYNKSSAVSAHLILNSAANRGESPQKLVQRWRAPEDSSFSHVRPGLTFRDNAIYVVSPGLYYVYCHILFDLEDEEKGSNSRLVSSYVLRDSLISPEASGILMKTRHFRHDDVNDRHGNYVGRLVLLDRGDNLYVKVSDPSLVSSDEKSSFFGLFRVGDA